jgi:hypothetical protein
MEPAQPTEPSKRLSEDAAGRYLDLYLGVYKHHFELFLKGLALYLAIIGGTAAYLYRDGATRDARVALWLFLFLVSALAIAGCKVSLDWVSAIEGTVTRLSTAIGLEPFPLDGAKGAKGIVTMVMLGAMVVLALATYNLWLGL